MQERVPPRQAKAPKNRQMSCKVTPTLALTRTLLVALTPTPALTLTLTLVLWHRGATAPPGRRGRTFAG